MKRDFFYVRRGTKKDWSDDNNLSNILNLLKETNIKFFVLAKHGNTNKILSLFFIKIRSKPMLRAQNSIHRLQKRKMKEVINSEGKQ